MAADWAGAQGAFGADLRTAASDSLTSSGKPLGKFTNLLGAAVSIALIGGIGVWGYKLFLRDVSGVPVVRALEGEMRVAPERPGGQQAAHQGLAVNAVAAEGGAQAPADRLVLAPRPVELTAEDAPMAVLAAAQEPEAEAKLSQVTPVEQDAEIIAASVSASAIDALVAELTRGVTPLGTLEETGKEATDSPAVTEVAAAVPDAVIDTPGVTRSLRPLSRPQRLASADVVQVAAAAPMVQSLDPASITTGTRMAQLGAYESEEVARAEWARISKEFGDYLEEKQHVIQRATSGGRVFFRLRAVGFDDLNDARRFCSALVAENADCIPVIAR